ncbi:Methylsterol monooxygenase [Smittium culicis]|uniref:Methylsterol monooxygenase n=1 Tax=Smittium culicis TaxID=133412 RepID=A0A1R1YG75_9FUNG|nr:Methylsterol monooxygenase [Smittium culicis]
MASMLDSPNMKTFIDAFYTVGNSTQRITPGYTPTKLESFWLSLFENRNEAITFCLVAFIHHTFFYYLRYLPYYIADYIPSLQKYKLQPDKVISKEQWWKCFRAVAFYEVIAQIPMMFFFYPAATLIGFEFSVPFPPFKEIALQCIAFLFIEDTFHYFVHRAMHIPFLYKKVHKVHHEFSAPFGITAEYAHPIETFVLGQGTIAGPLFFALCVQKVHIFTMLCWITVRISQAVEAHSGYDFPWSMNHWFPLWAGAEHHDYHHMAFVNNFASTFRHWDRILGTDISYLKYYHKKTAKKNSPSPKKVQ